LAELIHLRAAQSGEPVAAGLVDKPQLHNAVGAWIREGIDEDGVDNAKHGGRSPDAQGKRKHCGERETWALPEFASRIAQIG